MLATETLITIALNLLMGAVYAMVGRVVSRRRVSSHAELAKKSFAAWWYALSGVTVAGAVAAIMGAMGWWDLGGYLAYIQVILFIIVGALGALLYYFVYLFTGKRDAWKVIAAAYSIYFIAILYYLGASDPVGLMDSAQNGVDVEYANDLTGTAFQEILSILLILPVLLGAIGYVSLVRKVPDRSGKFRILSVAGGFIFWFGSSFIAGSLLDVANEPWWRLVSNAIALLASAMVYVAFAPPAWLRRALRVEGYDASPDAADESK